jgi:hypothetical protein
MGLDMPSFEWNDLEQALAPNTDALVAQFISEAKALSGSLTKANQDDLLKFVASNAENIARVAENPECRRLLRKFRGRFETYAGQYSHEYAERADRQKRKFDLGVLQLMICTQTSNFLTSTNAGLRIQAHALHLRGLLTFSSESAQQLFNEAATLHFQRSGIGDVVSPEVALSDHHLCKSFALRSRAFQLARFRGRQNYSGIAATFHAAAAEAHEALTLSPSLGDTHLRYLQFWEMIFQYRQAILEGNHRTALLCHRGAVSLGQTFESPDKLFAKPGRWTCFYEFKADYLLVNAVSHADNGRFKSAANDLADHAGILISMPKFNRDIQRRLELRRVVAEGLAIVQQRVISNAARSKVIEAKGLLKEYEGLGNATRALVALLERVDRHPEILQQSLREIAALFPAEAWYEKRVGGQDAQGRPRWFYERMSGSVGNDEARSLLWGRAYLRHIVEYLYSSLRDDAIERHIPIRLPELPDIRLYDYTDLELALRGIVAATQHWGETHVNMLEDLIDFCAVARSRTPVYGHLYALVGATAQLLSPTPIKIVETLGSGDYKCRGFAGPKDVVISTTDKLPINCYVFVKAQHQGRSQIRSDARASAEGKGLHIYPATTFGVPRAVRVFVEGTSDRIVYEDLLTHLDPDWRALDLKLENCGGSSFVFEDVLASHHEAMVIAILDRDAKPPESFRDGVCHQFYLDHDLEAESLDATAATIAQQACQRVTSSELRRLRQNLPSGRVGFVSALRSTYSVDFEKSTLAPKLGKQIIRYGIPRSMRAPLTAALLLSYGHIVPCTRHAPGKCGEFGVWRSPRLD